MSTKSVKGGNPIFLITYLLTSLVI